MSWLINIKIITHVYYQTTSSEDKTQRLLFSLHPQISRLMTKLTMWHVRHAKTQISLGISPVWSESSLCAQWVAKDPSFLHADSEDSDQTGRMPRLIWVFAGRTVILLVLSWGGSLIKIAFTLRKNNVQGHTVQCRTWHASVTNDFLKLPLTHY